MDNHNNNNNNKRDTLAGLCEQEIQELHRLFVTWFRGERPVSELEIDLCSRLLPTFSHVAPNGHMVKGRDVLLQYLTDKYGCYQDRIFSIDVYNVQLLWNSDNKFLASYEEWQSWDVDDDDDDEEDEDESDNNEQEGDDNNNEEGEGGRNTTKGKQQFGRLSTCLLEKDQKDGKFRWIHVHETWLEAEEPVVHSSLMESTDTYNADEDTVMTGPIPPSEIISPTRRNSSNRSNSGVTPMNPFESIEQGSNTVSVTTPINPFDSVHSTITSASDTSPPPQQPVATTNTITEISSKHVTILISNQSLSKEQIANQQTSLDVLSELRIMDFVETVDGTNPNDRQRRNELFEISKLKGTYPQFFINNPTTSFWGTFDAFYTAYKDGTLVEKLALDGASESVGPTSSANNTNNKREANQTAAEKPPKTQKTVTRSALLAPATIDVNPEDEFLEKSEGILVFEEEDETPPHLPTAKSSNSYNNISSGTQQQVAATTGSNRVVLPPQESILSKLVSPPDASKKRHVNPNLENFAKPLAWENALVGISIKGFDIGTSQGSVADTHWLNEMTQQLEEYGQSFSIPKPKRKLCLPEMIFPSAHVALEGHGVWLSWDATDALEQWAKCHQMIAVKSRIMWEGVNVLKTQDAKLWEQKAMEKKQKLGISTTTSSSNSLNNNASEVEDEAAAIFHYDWTFSTPFVVKAEGGTWIELDESAMRMELLKDLTVPILFFDDIILYEDDLHDNGVVQYSIKLRVMPSCAYILARLFVRVDNVILRVRETRVLIDFFGIKPQICRDITWKECHWDQLADHKLPTDIKSWTCDSTTSTAQKIQEWQRLLQELPEVRLPKNYFQHAVLEF